MRVPLCEAIAKLFFGGGGILYQHLIPVCVFVLCTGISAWALNSAIWGFLVWGCMDRPLQCHRNVSNPTLQYCNTSDMGTSSVRLDGSTLPWLTPRVIDARSIQEYMIYRYTYTTYRNTWSLHCGTPLYCTFVPIFVYIYCFVLLCFVLLCISLCCSLCIILNCSENKEVFFV